MSFELNSKEYWDHRFGSGHWEQCSGRNQTRAFAETQVKLLDIPPSFEGTILDFGCGLGDSIPVYHHHFPTAHFIGIDHSDKAIHQCKQMYGHLADFLQGDANCVPEVDIIIASNVMEHIADDAKVLQILTKKCSEIYVFVPFNENPLCDEHINTYDYSSFGAFPIMDIKTLYSRGWSQFGTKLWISVYLKNLLRPLIGKSLAKRRKQVMFRIKGSL